MAFDFIASQLKEREDNNLYRKITCSASKQGREIVFENKTYLNFSSNDYLGLASDPALIEAWKEGAERYGVGSGGSFLVTGNNEAHFELCNEIKSWLGVESVALFSSGYSANQAILKLLFAHSSKQTDCLIQDKLNHASLMEAGMLAPCSMKRFKHNDTKHLEQLLCKLPSTTRNKLIISEGVFSMDGDQAPISELSTLSKNHQAWLMIDDAHGLGVLGKEGRGSVASFESKALSPDIYMATFGKALGVSGAFVAGSKEFIDYLTNFSKAYIYTTAFPPAMAYTILTSIKMVRKDQWRRDKLNALISHFQLFSKKMGFDIEHSQTAIQPIIIGESEKAMRITHALKSQGFWLTAIRPPTVPKGSARLRVTLTVNHEVKDIEDLLLAIKKALSS